MIMGNEEKRTHFDSEEDRVRYETDALLAKAEEDVRTQTISDRAKITALLACARVGAGVAIQIARLSDAIYYIGDRIVEGLRK
jgi:hypothetical protein